MEGLQEVQGHLQELFLDDHVVDADDFGGVAEGDEGGQLDLRFYLRPLLPTHQEVLGLDTRELFDAE